MGVRISERKEMQFADYHISGKHVLEKSSRVAVGLAIVRWGLRIGSWLGGFNVIVDEPQVALFRRSAPGRIEFTEGVGSDK